MKLPPSFAAAAVLILLAACNPAAAPSAEQLVGPAWIVEDLNGQAIVDTAGITLNFNAEGRIAGRSGCNQYTGSYSLDEGLSIGPLAQTKMACPGALMEQENRFTRILGKVNSFSFSDSGALLLSTPGGKTIRAVAR